LGKFPQAQIPLDTSRTGTIEMGPKRKTAGRRGRRMGVDGGLIADGGTYQRRKPKSSSILSKTQPFKDVTEKPGCLRVASYRTRKMTDA